MGELVELRAAAAAALAAVALEDWSVHEGPVDAVTPPAFVIVWPDPWLVQNAVCTYSARLEVICVAARIDPLPGYEQLEQMVEAAIPALVGAQLPLVTVGAASNLEIGGVRYQTARVTVARHVRIEGAMP